MAPIIFKYACPTVSKFLTSVPWSDESPSLDNIFFNKVTTYKLPRIIQPTLRLPCIAGHSLHTEYPRSC